MGPLEDLRAEMDALAERLGPAPGAVARLVQFVAAAPGEGTSTIARAFAEVVAAISARPVWLVELDLMRGDQHRAINAEPALYGHLGDPTRASPNHASFFTVQPQIHDDPGLDAAFLAAYRVGRSNLYVTRFKKERLSPGQTVHLLAGDEYWRAVAMHADYVVVDAPAWSRSKAAGMVAPHMDANLMVVAADGRDPEAALALRGGLERAGGAWAGVVVNRAPKLAPRFIRSLIG